MTAFVEVKGSYALSPFPRGTCGLLWTDLHPEGPAFKSLTAHHIQLGNDERGFEAEADRV